MISESNWIPLASRGTAEVTSGLDEACSQLNALWQVFRKEVREMRSLGGRDRHRRGHLGQPKVGGRCSEHAGVDHGGVDHGGDGLRDGGVDLGASW